MKQYPTLRDVVSAVVNRYVAESGDTSFPEGETKVPSYEDSYRRQPIRKDYSLHYNCTHSAVMPQFTEDEMRKDFGLDTYTFRKKYPRFMGECPMCGQSVILYSSYVHYIAGDW